MLDFYNFFSTPQSFAFMFLIGVSIGSFINVLIFRLPLMMEYEWRDDIKAYFKDKKIKSPNFKETKTTFNSLMGKSCCPHCQTPIKPHYNIPVFGWLILKGRSGCCNKTISARYPIVEAIFGIVFSVSTLFLTPEVALPLLLAFTLLFSMSLIDHDTMLLPDSLIYSLLWSGLLLHSLIPLELNDMIYGAILGYLSIYAINIMTQLTRGVDAFGYGDAKLIAALGVWVGMNGIAWIAFLAPITFLIYNVVFNSKQDKKAPFGPALAVTGAIVIVLQMICGINLMSIIQ